MIQIAGIDEPARKNDGWRVLVDRLWSRGVNKENAHVDLWMNDIAPSAVLRKWLGHKPERWAAGGVGEEERTGGIEASGEKRAER